MNLGLSTPTVNSILKCMVEKDMVTITVQPDDKRLKAIRLTEKSQELSVKKKEKIVDIQQRQIIGTFFSVIQRRIG